MGGLVGYVGKRDAAGILLDGRRALKLKEMSDTHAQGCVMMHGPIALIEESMPIVARTLPRRLLRSNAGNVEEAKALGRWVIAICHRGMTG